MDMEQTSELQARASEIVIAHPLMRQAHDRLGRMCEQSRSGRFAEGSCMLINGPSQSGKTTICREFQRGRNIESKLEVGIVPVIHLSIPSRITRKGLLQDILLRIEDFGFFTAPSSGTESVLLDRVCKSLRNLQTELLIIDECHHLKRGTRDEYAADVGEMIKSILLRGACSVAMAGVGEAAEAPFSMNEQLALRAEKKLSLNPLRADKAAERKLFFDFLVDYLIALEQRGIINNAEAVANKEIAYAVHEVTGGLLGRVCRLIRHALAEMSERRDSGLSVEDLAAAAEVIAQHTSPRANPFR